MTRRFSLQLRETRSSMDRCKLAQKRLEAWEEIWDLIQTLNALIHDWFDNDPDLIECQDQRDRAAHHIQFRLPFDAGEPPRGDGPPTSKSRRS